METPRLIAQVKFETQGIMEYEADNEGLFRLVRDCSTHYQGNQQQYRELALDGMFNFMIYDDKKPQENETLEQRLNSILALETPKIVNPVGPVEASKTIGEALEKGLGFSREEVFAYFQAQMPIYEQEVQSVTEKLESLTAMISDLEKQKIFNFKHMREFVETANRYSELMPLRKGDQVENTRLALKFADLGLYQITEKLKENKAVHPEVDDTPFYQYFFRNDILREYDALTTYVTQNLQIAGNSSSLERTLNQCNSTFNAKTPFYSALLCEEQDRLYEQALAVASQGDEAYLKEKEKFSEFSKTYSIILEEDTKSFNEAITEIESVYKEATSKTSAQEIPQPVLQ